MKKSFVIRVTAAAVAVAAAPFAVSAVIKNPPNMNALMAAAVDFTAGSYVTESIDLGNGSLILYKPSPSEAAAETEDEPAAETTAETAAQTQTEPVDSGSETVTEENGSSDYIITQNISTDTEDLTVYNSHDGEVEELTFGSGAGDSYITLSSGAQIRNCTSLDNDFVAEQTEISSDIEIELYSDEPQVLIMHTHTCESYLTDDSGYYDSDYTNRTTDPTQSVVAVGQKIAEKLAENGICVIHDGTMHDYPLYNGSYDRAAETVTEILSAYPSIKVVLDIHRDGIEESDGTPVAAVTEIDGKQAAQVMIISAAGDDYYYVPNYLENFHLACLLQNQMESDNPSITRPVLFEYCQYNQHLTTGSLLIEVGSHGNTLEQALYTGELIGESIAKALISLS